MSEATQRAALALAGVHVVRDRFAPPRVSEVVGEPLPIDGTQILAPDSHASLSATTWSKSTSDRRPWRRGEGHDDAVDALETPRPAQRKSAAWLARPTRAQACPGRSASET